MSHGSSVRTRLLRIYGDPPVMVQHGTPSTDHPTATNTQKEAEQQPRRTSPARPARGALPALGSVLDEPECLVPEAIGIVGVEGIGSHCAAVAWLGEESGLAAVLEVASDRGQLVSRGADGEDPLEQRGR
jgi:hypothetical protein